MGVRNNIKRALRLFKFSNVVADNSLDGRTDELPKKTPQGAVDAALLLNPTVGDTVRVKEAQGGLFEDGVQLGGSVLFEGTQTSFVSTDSIVVDAANNITFKAQASIALAPGGVAVNIDGKKNFASTLDAARALGGSGAVYDIKNACDNILTKSEQIIVGLKATESENASTGDIGFRVRSSCPTPQDHNGDVVLLDGDDATFVDYQPSVGTDLASFNYSTITSAGDNSTGYVVRSAFLTARVDVLDVDMAFDVKDGATGVLNPLVATGAFVARTGAQNNIVGAALIQGNLTAEGTGTLQAHSQTIIGDVLVESNANMSTMADTFIGNIVNNGGMFGIIGNLIGALTGTGVFNGVINGVHRGNWRQKPIIEQVLFGEESGNQGPDVLDDEHAISFGNAQGSASDPIELLANGTTICHENDQYDYSVSLQYGRSGSGGVAFLFFRVLVNDVQFGKSVFAKLDGSGDNIPVQFDAPINLVEDDEVRFEFYRDSQSSGNNSGSLETQNPTLAGWQPAASATLRVFRFRLVQESI